MEKLKSLGMSIVERAKTDKKFLGALIGGAVVVVVLIVALAAGSGGSSSQGGGGNTDYWDWVATPWPWEKGV